MRKLLIIDDHPAIVMGYKALLSNSGFDLITAEDCESGIRMLSEFKSTIAVAIIDIMLPTQGTSLTSGIDLATYARQSYPQLKIIIVTGFDAGVSLYRIFRKIYPNALISKTECSRNRLQHALKVIFEGNVYVSPEANKKLKCIQALKSNIDWTDMHLLELLGQGIKTKSLPKYLNLSLSAIDKRKAQMKSALGADGRGDEKLLTVARNLGLL